MIPKMPEEYKGNLSKKTEYTNTNPRNWTKKEIEWVKLLLSKGYTINDIAKSVDRSTTSVSIKIKRLEKKENNYNKNHIIEKYFINNQFLNYIKPKTVLDLYCGVKNFYKNYQTITNDININIQADYHKDSLKLLCELYSKDYKFDLIDLDPFGSAYDCFDLAIKMAKKGICITLGELGHLRWKRLDFVNRYYGINKIEDFNIENLIKHIQKIGLKNKKELIVYDYKKWNKIGRVWFEIKDIKVLKPQIDAPLIITNKKQMTIDDFLGDE